MATEKQAPEAVLNVIKFGCAKIHCTNVCLHCTDNCMCCKQDDDDECDNADQGRILKVEDAEEETEDVKNEDIFSRKFFC